MCRGRCGTVARRSGPTANTRGAGCRTRPRPTGIARLDRRRPPTVRDHLMSRGSLLLAGANDPALGPQAMRATWMQWYPNAELEVLPDTGHYAPEESPEAVAAAVERYLGR
ncbi:alpha/beta fold hydrolase [Streptomyces sp. NPDC051366]|uniref:alpha/beta fold hydrolase n=1 Tax=Streptomyces sp. NPDC051366 TaxID=3365652 RepID=UPI0037A683C1